MSTSIPTFGKVRSHVEAWALDAMAGQLHAQHGKMKAAAIADMHGTIVEIGAGTGANMRYYNDGIRLIAVEPNPIMHPRLRAAAAEHGVDVEIRTLAGEAMDVADDEADHVVGTLVLCGVADPDQVVREVRRILRPGGTYLFVEHVVGTERATVLLQRATRRAQQWAANGCDVMRDTGALLRSAGFSSIEIEELDSGWRGFNARTQIRGLAIA